MPESEKKVVVVAVSVDPKTYHVPLPSCCSPYNKKYLIDNIYRPQPHQFYPISYTPYLTTILCESLF
jgi:hypothetical protein